jgi:hypothetical protein
MHKTEGESESEAGHGVDQMAAASRSVGVMCPAVSASCRSFSGIPRQSAAPPWPCLMLHSPLHHQPACHIFVGRSIDMTCSNGCFIRRAAPSGGQFVACALQAWNPRSSGSLLGPFAPHPFGLHAHLTCHSSACASTSLPLLSKPS